MTKNKPTNIQAVREARSAEVIAEANQAEQLPPALAAADQELAESFEQAANNSDEAAAAAKDAADVQGLGQVQVSIEEMFQIIGAQEYELRALRQRVPVLIQQVLTLKGVVRQLEAGAKKK